MLKLRISTFAEPIEHFAVDAGGLGVQVAFLVEERADPARRS
jgi:hypothetical protein